MKITAREFRAAAQDVDDLHHQQMKTFAEEAADLHLDAARASRRRFMKYGAAGAGLVAASPFLPGNGFLGMAAAQSLTDTQIAGFAQGFELVAVAAYAAAAPELSDGTRPVAELFGSHHQQHADAFGAVAGDDAQPEANAKILADLGPLLEDAIAKGEVAILELAQIVENEAAYTYAFGLTLLQDKAFASAAATILPIEAQHAATIGLALGQSPADQFPTGAFEAAVVGSAGDPMTGVDPAQYS